MIILDARRIKAYDTLNEIGRAAGKDTGFLDRLWTEMCADNGFKDELKCCGYGLTDLYFYLMRRFEVSQDIGKNYADCDKEALVLETFDMMVQMKKDPEPVIRRLEEGLGMDFMR